MPPVDQSVQPLPRSRSHPLQAPDGLAKLAGRGLTRVRFPNGVDSWLATGYDDVRMVLSDPRCRRW